MAENWIEKVEKRPFWRTGGGGYQQMMNMQLFSEGSLTVEHKAITFFSHLLVEFAGGVGGNNSSSEVSFRAGGRFSNPGVWGIIVVGISSSEKMSSDSLPLRNFCGSNFSEIGNSSLFVI